MRAGRAVVAIGVLGVVQQKQSWKMQHRTECPCRVSHDLISRPTPPTRASIERRNSPLPFRQTLEAPSEPTPTRPADTRSHQQLHITK